jgi:hypothetical protein
MAFRSALLPALIPLCAALTIGACDRGPDDYRERSETSSDTPMRAVSRLTCPEDQGSLRRVSAAADGRTCAYEGSGGVRVALRIVPLDGERPDSALAPVEAELRALMPVRPPRTPGGDGSGDTVNVRIPGVNIDADDDGAEISIGGVHVNAGGDRAQVRLDSDGAEEDGPERGRRPVVRRTSTRGDVMIDARQDGAEVRVTAPGRSVRMTYILASSNRGPQGDRLVAYEARGPRGGPLVVATLRSRDDSHSAPIAAMKALVRRNDGG